MQKGKMQGIHPFAMACAPTVPDYRMKGPFTYDVRQHDAYSDISKLILHSYHKGLGGGVRQMSNLLLRGG